MDQGIVDLDRTDEVEVLVRRLREYCQVEGLNLYWEGEVVAGLMLVGYVWKDGHLTPRSPSLKGKGKEVMLAPIERAIDYDE